MTKPRHQSLRKVLGFELALSAVSKDEQVSRQLVLLQQVRHHPAESIKAASHIGRLRAHMSLHPLNPADQGAATNLSSTARSGCSDLQRWEPESTRRTEARRRWA